MADKDKNSSGQSADDKSSEKSCDDKSSGQSSEKSSEESSDKSSEKSSSSSQRDYPLIEWISAAAGLLITAVLFGLLAYEAIRQRDGLPPILTIEPTAAVKAGGQYVVELKVRNVARKTAASVQVEGVLKSGGQEVETSSVAVDYVPGESVRQAALVFTHDPRDYNLDLRVTGYTRP